MGLWGTIANCENKFWAPALTVLMHSLGEECYVLARLFFFFFFSRTELRPLLDVIILTSEAGPAFSCDSAWILSGY